MYTVGKRVILSCPRVTREPRGVFFIKKRRRRKILGSDFGSNLDPCLSPPLVSSRLDAKGGDSGFDTSWSGEQSQPHPHRSSQSDVYKIVFFFCWSFGSYHNTISPRSISCSLAPPPTVEVAISLEITTKTRKAIPSVMPAVVIIDRPNRSIKLW